jgi:hypothetical protein
MTAVVYFAEYITTFDFLAGVRQSGKSRAENPSK